MSQPKFIYLKNCQRGNKTWETMNSVKWPIVKSLNADLIYYLNTKAMIMYAQWFVVRKGDNCFNWNYVMFMVNKIVKMTVNSVWH
jgi:hypothetical protein